MAANRLQGDRRRAVDALRVEMLSVAALRPNPKNPRKHSSRQLKRLAALIREVGFINPVIVDETKMILAGHGRVAAARKLGLTEIPVIIFDYLTPAQKRAYLIADNRIAEQAGWDQELLAVELGELIELLPAEGLDVTLTGFEVAEIDLLIANMATSPPAQEDVLPTLPNEVVSRSGDLWQLGKHRLLCGDAREAGNFVRLMDGTSAAAVFCDPPYNLRVSDIGGRGKIQHPEFAFASGEMQPAEYREFLSQTLGNGVRVSADGAVHFACMDWRHIADLIEVGRGIYGAMLNLVVWNKTNSGQGSFYRSQHELIGVFRVGEKSHKNNVQLGRFGRNRSNLWSYAGANTFSPDRMNVLSVHPTVKPVALVADAILDCTARGDVVLDQFAGSGTIVLAAEKTGRVAYAMEYEARYVDVAVRRWESVTKLEATLARDGRTFDEVAASRLSRGESRTHQSAQGGNHRKTRPTDRERNDA
jgi:DNA modification methylase